MLQTIRDRATGWIAYVIVGLLIIPFALWGVHEYAGGGDPLQVAEVGGVPISLYEFQQAYQQQRQRLQAQLGSAFDPGVFDEQVLKREVLNRLVDEALLRSSARRQGFRVGDARLQEAIRAIDAFQRGGSFDAGLYEQVLRTQGYTPTSFEDSLRGSLMLDQLRQGVMDSVIVTPASLERAVALINEKRDLRYLVLPLERYREAVEVEESAVERYYADNQDRFARPEQVRLEYVDLSADALARDIPVTEEELRATYEEHKARYGQDERRETTHILFKAPAGAEPDVLADARRRAQVAHGAIAADSATFDETLAAVLSEDAVEGGSLGIIERGTLEPAFEEALFALDTPGAVSAPVQTSFGVHLLRLDAIIPGDVRPLPEVREEVIETVRRRRGEQRYYDAADTLASISFEQPHGLEAAAEAVGLPVERSGWIERGGGEGIGRFPAVLEAAFSDEVLLEKLNSEPLEVEPGRVVVVRVLEHRERSTRALEEVREEVVADLRASRAREALAEDVGALLERARAGEDLASLAAARDVELRTPGLVQRGRASGVDAAVLAAAFELPPPGPGGISLDEATLGSGDRALVAVTAVVPGNAEELDAGEREALARRLASRDGAREFRALVEALRASAEIVTYPDRL